MIKHIGIFFWSLISVVLSSGLIVKFIDNLGKQRELYAVMVAFQNECNYNTHARVSEESSFQIDWLGKALSLLEFHEQFPGLVQKSLEISELMKDANSGSLEKRENILKKQITHDHLVDLIQQVSEEINILIPILKKRATFKGYFSWIFGLHDAENTTEIF